EGDGDGDGGPGRRDATNTSAKAASEQPCRKDGHDHGRHAKDGLVGNQCGWAKAHELQRIVDCPDEDAIEHRAMSEGPHGTTDAATAYILDADDVLKVAVEAQQQ